jgi:hypothetical protein
MNNDTTTPTTAPRPTRGGRDEEPAETRASKTEAGEVSALTRHRDPSLTEKTAEAAKDKAEQKRPGVEWVRPSELLASRSARVAGRGIDFQAELARRTRRAPGHVARGTRRSARAGARFVSERARRLPPVSDFGRGPGPSYSWVSRSGIGLG